ncbi:uncharacterized mitochondrial protein AtMg00820-like [Jatropha curcas]|uniref:uncharacterized mitochondrial protein AtMg00820-like n=1 Tax=Jatropha curcas TaxID=180498 RepID=UPI001895978C|nr:uncharacterized mitochondrial protein AtMg00820-like [Jatropha curcas]
MDSSIPKEPRTVKQALAHSGWKKAMEEELSALHKNETWTLVPRTHDMNVIGSKWVFKAKLKSDGSLDRLKPRLVAKGYHQVDGQDFTETFSPVVKPGTIRLVLSIALVRRWKPLETKVQAKIGGKESVENKKDNEDIGGVPWSAGDDIALLNALKAFPKDVAMRWEKIAAEVPGKSMAACRKRVAKLKRDFPSSKAGAESQLKFFEV